MARRRFRYSLRTLLLTTAIVAVVLCSYVNRVTIWAHVRYGPRVAPDAVEVLAIDSGAYILRVCGKNVLTEKCPGFLQPYNPDVSVKIKGVWRDRWRESCYVVVVGNEFLSAAPCSE
jgi:hypothetical protein